jgi:very-short-patch-repair endonuclease
VLAEPRPHVAAPGHAGHVASAVGHVHWAAPVVPRHPDALVDPVENVLAVAASCLPHEEALAVWESALRQGMVDIREMRRLDLGPAARALCDEADPYADSGLESFAVPRLRWLGLPLRRQVWIAGHRVDLLIGERLAFQIDGGHHVGAQREEDIAHDVALGLLGYRVIRVGYRTIVDDWASVQERIMRAIAQGWHRA